MVILSTDTPIGVGVGVKVGEGVDIFEGVMVALGGTSVAEGEGFFVAAGVTEDVGSAETDMEGNARGLGFEDASEVLWVLI